jgi:hypothetical protein
MIVKGDATGRLIRYWRGRFLERASRNRIKGSAVVLDFLRGLNPDRDFWTPLEIVGRDGWDRVGVVERLAQAAQCCSTHRTSGLEANGRDNDASPGNAPPCSCVCLRDLGYRTLWADREAP